MTMTEIVQYVEIEKYNLTLGIDSKIDLALIKECCGIRNIKYIGGGTVFVDKQQIKTNTLDLLKTNIEKQLPNKSYVVMYSDLNKYHPQFYYYDIIAISTSNLDDLKKIMKVYKMKVFI